MSTLTLDPLLQSTAAEQSMAERTTLPLRNHLHPTRRGPDPPGLYEPRAFLPTSGARAGALVCFALATHSRLRHQQAEALLALVKSINRQLGPTSARESADE